MRPIREVHYAMGTLLDIALFTKDQEEGKKVLRRCFQEARRLEALFSAYDEESGLSRLNRQAGLGPVEVEEDLFTILSVSLDLSQRTGGAFDPTIGPLLDLWQRAVEQGRSPERSALQKTLSLVGVSRIRLLPGRRVTLCEKGMRLDLGGIGKGYAVDQIIDGLKKEGIRKAFINFGLSSLSALGSPPGAEAWPILIRDFHDGGFAGRLDLKNLALSASGTFGRSLDIGGKRYGHLIDPRSGFPLDRPAIGIALAPTATEAEALSSALLVLGPKEGLLMIERSPAGEGFYLEPPQTIWVTPGIGRRIPFEAARGWEVKCGISVTTGSN